MDPIWTHYGSPMDPLWTPYGPSTPFAISTPHFRGMAVLKVRYVPLDHLWTPLWTLYGPSYGPFIQRPIYRTPVADPDMHALFDAVPHCQFELVVRG